MTIKFNRLTALLSKDRAAAVNRSTLATILGNVLIALSGFVLYSDKALSWIDVSFPVQEKWAEVGMNFQTYIWFLSQTISPLLIIIGASLRPRTIMYIIPIYCYILQLYWILIDHKIVDDSYLQMYVVGTSILLLAAIYLLRWLLYRRVGKKIEEAKKRILNNG